MENTMKIPLLVGGIPTPLKNMSSSVEMMTFHTLWKNKCSKPPSRLKWMIRGTPISGHLGLSRQQTLPQCDHAWRSPSNAYHRGTGYLS